ncbi:Beta-glucanase [Thalassocella blandensis]|nr:Beta-glucanase [Thalassocella blandensis]
MKIRLLATGFFVVINCCFAAIASAEKTLTDQCQQLVWQDEFNGASLNLKNWDIMLADGCSYGICGWGNQELQYYTAKNFQVADGLLTITAKKESVKNKQYTSARLRTANMPGSGEWTFGRFEARIKIPEGDGIWPAFWMLPTDPDVQWPASGEIDIMEATGQATRIAFGTIHYGDSPETSRFTNQHVLSQPQKWSDDFHTYALEWEPNELRWYVDDYIYAVKRPKDLGNEKWWTFDKYPYHILLNLAVGGILGGAVDDKVFPVHMLVDYVRVYNKGGAAIKGPHIVASGEKARYQVIGENGEKSEYRWQVPNGAKLVGAGNHVEVDFGVAKQGDISVQVKNSCGQHQLKVPVFIEPDHPVETMLDDFDKQRELEIVYHTGQIKIKRGNLHYTRKADAQWDLIVGNTKAIPDVAPMLSGEKAFVMKLKNTNPDLIGKPILIQLEDSTVSTPNNYPRGRHSKFEAHIQHADGWQTLRFRLADRKDALTRDTSINSIVILIDPGEKAGDTYIIDSIAVLGDGARAK